MKSSVKKIKVDVKAYLTSRITPPRYNEFGERYYASEVSQYTRQKISEFLSNESLWEISLKRPFQIESLSYFEIRVEAKDCCADAYLYQDSFYLVSDNFTAEQRELLVLEFADNERRFFEKMKSKFFSVEAIEAAKPRQRILEAVRIAVWRRDGGKCVECGCKENLEYDHIIPFEKGGASTVRNVQLLCGSCNKQKSNRIDEIVTFALTG